MPMQILTGAQGREGESVGRVKNHQQGEGSWRRGHVIYELWTVQKKDGCWLRRKSLQENERDRLPNSSKATIIRPMEKPLIV